MNILFTYLGRDSYRFNVFKYKDDVNENVIGLILFGILIELRYF